MNVYISGPVTGNDNYEADFARAWDRLMSMGYYPVSPVGVGIILERRLGRTPTWAEYMREDIKALMDCEGIYMLDGWEVSEGARLEEWIAFTLGIKRITL